MMRKKTVTVLQPNAEVDHKNPVKVYEYNRILKEFENDKEFIQLLSTSGIDIDLYLLSSISYQIQKYQEINFGRDAIKSNHSLFTKLPVQLFQDYSANGSLSVILKEALIYQQEQNMKSFDILSTLGSGQQSKDLNESSSDEFLHVLRKIQTSLIEFLKRPVISFSKNISAKDRKIYKSIVVSHGGTVVENADTTAATGLSLSSPVTHMVEWNEEIDSLVIPSSSNLTTVLASLNSSSNSSTADLSQQQQQVPTEEEFIRPLAIDWEDNSALVHWYYYPDSYDEKIPREEIEVDVTETFTTMAKTLNMTGSSGGIATVAGAGSDSSSSAVPMNIDDDGVSFGTTANVPSVTTKPAMLTVCCRYLIDLERFNEWGNEEDYIVEINTADSVFDSIAASVDGGSKTGLTLTLKRKSKRKSNTGGLSKAAQLSQKGSQQQSASLSSTSTDQQLLTKEQYSTTGYDASVNLFLDVTVPSKRMDATKVTVSDLTNDADIKVYQESENTGTAVTATGAGFATEVTDDDKKAAATTAAGTGSVSMDTSTTDDIKHDDKTTDKSKTESKQEKGDDGDEQQPQDKKQKTSHNDNDDEDDSDNSHLPSWFIKNAVSTFEREHLPWLNNNDTTTAAALDIEYLQIRNRIMTLASQQQSSSSAVYLSATQCRRMMAFNVNTILAVHSFLDAYGIINQNVSARLKPTYTGFPTDSSSSSTTTATTAVEFTDEEKKSVGLSLDEYLSLRLDALHKKTKLFVDIEQSIDSRLNSVAVERRDVQIQRAQLAMVAAAVSGSSGGQDMMSSGGGGNMSSSSALSSR